MVRIALVLETRHPELLERISSDLELLAMGDAAAAQGSRQLIDLLARDARVDLARVSARQEFRGDSQRPALAGAGAVLLILVLLLVVWPRQTTLLLKRAVAPHRTFDNLHAAAMTVEPGDTRLLAGQSLTLRLRVPVDHGHRAEATIETAGRHPALERMRRVSASDAREHVFALTLPSVQESFRYRLRLGPGLTRRYRVEVIPPPAHGDLTLSYRFPPHTGLTDTQLVVSAACPIRAIAGTRLRLSTQLNRPLESTLLLGDRRLPPTTAAGTEVHWEWRLATNTATQWALALRDASGFTNALAWAGYQVEPDYPPDVQLTYPSGASFTLPTYGLLRMSYALSDDFGLGTVKLNVKGEGDFNEWALDVQVEPKGPNRWVVNRELALAEFQLGGVRQLRIWLSVDDNLPPELGGPNRSRSRLIALNLDDRQTRSLADQVRVPQRDNLTNLIAQAAAKLDEAALAIGQLKQEALAATNLAEAVRAQVAAAATQAAEAAERVDQAAREAAPSLFAGVVPELRETTREALVPALAETEAVLLAEPETRAEQAQRSLDALQQAAAETKELLGEIAARDERLERAAAIENLASLERQQAEQARARQMIGEEMAAWQKRQEALAAQLRETAQKPPEAAATEPPAAEAAPAAGRPPGRAGRRPRRSRPPWRPARRCAGSRRRARGSVRRAWSRPAPAPGGRPPRLPSPCAAVPRPGAAPRPAGRGRGPAAPPRARPRAPGWRPAASGGPAPRSRAP